MPARRRPRSLQEHRLGRHMGQHGTAGPVRPHPGHQPFEPFLSLRRGEQSSDRWIERGLQEHRLGRLMGWPQHGTDGPVRPGPRHRPLQPQHAIRRDIQRRGLQSIDGGGSWTATNTGLTNLGVNALVINPANPITLYVGTPGAGIFKSTDGGDSWTAVNTGLISTDVRVLAIDPETPTTLYANTVNGVFTRVPTAEGAGRPSAGP